MIASRRTSIRTGRRTRKSTAVLTTMLVIFGTSALFTSAKPTAAANFPNLQVVSLSSVRNSTNKSVTVNCPAGLVVINAGGDIINGHGSVTMEGVVPDPALNSVTVTAYETDPTPNKWRIRARASCATAPPGFAWHSMVSPSNTSDKSVTATCPAGTTLLGTGASVQGGSGNVIIDEIKPDGGGYGMPGTKVTVEAYKDRPAFPVPWSVTAFVSCAAPIPGQQVIWRNSGFNAKNVKSIVSSCPAGQVATGGAAEVGALGALPGEVVINDMYPFGAPAAGAPTSTRARAYEEDPITPPDQWAITTITLCAPK